MGMKCTDLPAFIINRLPVRFVFDNNYYNDIYQGIPIGGSNKLIDGLLNGVETRTGVDFFENRSYWEDKAKKVVYSGKLDEFFDYRYGKLSCRTVCFKQEIHVIANYQGNAVVNYINAEVPYTRIIKHKHFELFGQEVYDILQEYSVEWKEGMEPYYPINDIVNGKLAKKNYELVKLEPNVIFGGHLVESNIMIWLQS